jgi:hypothetical protein
MAAKRVQAIQLFVSILRVVSLGKDDNAVSNRFQNTAIRNKIYSTLGAIVDAWVSVADFGISPTSMGLLTIIGPWVFQACATEYQFKWKVPMALNMDPNTLVHRNPSTMTGTIAAFCALCAVLSVRASPSETNQSNGRLAKGLLRGYEILHVGLGMRSENDATEQSNCSGNTMGNEDPRSNLVCRTILSNGTNVLGTGHRGVWLLLPSFLGAIQCVHRKRLKVPSRSPKKSTVASTAATFAITPEERSKAVVILTSIIAPQQRLTVPSLALWSVTPKASKNNEAKWHEHVPFFLRRLLALKLLLHLHKNETNQNIRAQCVHSIALGLYHRMKVQEKEVKAHVQLIDRVCNLRTVLHDRCLREELRLFCESEYSSENIEFWLATEAYRELDILETRKEKASQILIRFIGSSALQEVNIPAKMRTQLLARVKEGSYGVELFHEAQEEIFHLLRKDTLPRFCAGLKTTYCELSNILLDCLVEQITVSDSCLPHVGKGGAVVKDESGGSNNNSSSSANTDAYAPCLAAAWSLATLASWHSNVVPGVVVMPALVPSTFVTRLAQQIESLATGALRDQQWKADHLLTQLLLALQNWLFVPSFKLGDTLNSENQDNQGNNNNTKNTKNTTNTTTEMFPHSLLEDSKVSNAVFSALEACLCFGCGGNIVPKDFDRVRVPASSRTNTGISTSSALVRILRLLKHSPDMNGTNIHLRPSFFLTEALIKIMQRQFDVYPTLQGPASCSSVVREPFMNKEALPSSSSASATPTSPKPASVVFGYQSKIMSLTEMPPNETCRLSRVRVVVRDVTGRFCWDLIPASADPEGSEALCYHTSDPVSLAAVVGNDRFTAMKPSLPVTLPPTVVRHERTYDLLEFIKSQGTDASTQFGEFIATFDPHRQKQQSQQSQQSQQASIGTTEMAYEAQLAADQVHGLGCGVLQQGSAKSSVTLGAPESGCQSVCPIIQNGQLTSFDRCRQALAHVRLIFVYCLCF